MLIHILNSDLKILDILRKYTFVQYADKAREIGAFQILAEVVDENKYLLNPNEQFYALFDGGERFGKIESVTEDTDGEYENTINIKGRMSPVIFQKRVIDGTIKFSGSSVNYIKAILDKCFLMQDHQDPRFINMIPEYDSDEEIENKYSKIERQVTGGYAWDEIKETLEIDKLCLTLDPIVETTTMDRGSETNIKQWDLKITKGHDRRRNNEEGNEAIVFSRSLSNISRTAFTMNTQNYCNIAYAAGEGEEENRKWFTASINGDAQLPTSEKGWNRSELWIDARDIQSTQEEGTDMTDEQYEALINERISEKAVENSVSRTYEGTISANSRYKYGTHYFLGDWVTVEDYDLGIQVDAQVIGITITEQGSKRIEDVSVLYGKYIRDVSDEIKDNTENIKQIQADIKYIKTVSNKLDDYVIESGDDGIWAYKKWRSGRLEAWTVGTNEIITSFPLNFGNVFYHDITGFETSGGASQFVSVENVTGSTAGGGIVWISIVNYSVNNKKARVGFYIASATQQQYRIKISLRIDGSWK